jgi:glycosyltransferase involved in cell wall biosynthesis
VFTGNVPYQAVPEYYAQIDLFVVPRIDDRAARMVSPLKPLEAMAMRIPLLVADLAALTEIVGADSRGHVFRAGDPAALAAAAVRLMDAPAERERVVDAAATWVASERSWSSVASAFGAAYDELADRLTTAPSAGLATGSSTIDGTSTIEARTIPALSNPGLGVGAGVGEDG